MKYLLLLALLVVAISSRAAEPPAEPPSPRFVMMQAAKHITAINSIRFAFRGELIAVEAGKNPTERVETKTLYDDRFYYSDGKYRHEYKALAANTPDKGMEMVSAYDGKRYQFFDKKTRELGLHTAKPQVTAYGMNPVLWPLSFASTGFEQMEWSTMRLPVVWEMQASSCKYIETRIEHASEIVVLEKTVDMHGLPKSTTQISFSKKLGWYPIQSTGSTKEGAYTSRVTRFHTVATKDGVLVIPLNTELISNSGPSSTTIRFEILPDTLKVNEPIDDSLFTIPVSEAKKVNDIDQLNALIAQKLCKPSPPPSLIASLSPTRVMVLVGVTSLLLAALLWWASRRRTRLRSIPIEPDR